jgi:cytochrome b involved in lipid metabolism
MRKLVFAAFIAFWASVGTLVLVNLLAPEPPTARPGAADETPAQYTLEQIARHDSLDDCWMAIRGEVYDFTDYVPHHPTRPRVLEPYCGTDATWGMETKGRGRPHTDYAWRLMDGYWIGTLTGDADGE